MARGAAWSIGRPVGRPQQGRAPHPSLALGGEATLHAIEAAAVLCKRWKPAIRCLLVRGHQRCDALHRRLPGGTPTMLTQQLRELEQNGLVSKTVVPGGPEALRIHTHPAG